MVQIKRRNFDSVIEWERMAGSSIGVWKLCGKPTLRNYVRSFLIARWFFDDNDVNEVMCARFVGE